MVLYKYAEIDDDIYFFNFGPIYPFWKNCSHIFKILCLTLLCPVFVSKIFENLSALQSSSLITNTE